MKTMRERVTLSSDRYSTEETKNRLRELILYVAGRCESHEDFGAMKLNKILFISDLTSYLRHRESISGSQYQKLLQGPVPLHLFTVRKEMTKNGDIDVRKKKIHQGTQNIVIPLRPANLGIFAGRDIALLDQIIEELMGRPAGDLPNGVGWDIATVREIIPYETVLLDDRGVHQRDIEEAQRLISEHGWCDV